MYIAMSKPEHERTAHRGWQERREPADHLERPLRILLVEDQPLNRLTVQFLLDPMDVELWIAGDGAEGLQLFRAGGFDLVLMDVEMPVMDGLAATSAIRAHERATGVARTPIAMLTARISAQDRAATLAAGADLHLSKPVDPDQLQALVSDFMSNRKA